MAASALRLTLSFPLQLLKELPLLIGREPLVTKEFLSAKFDCTHNMAWVIEPANSEEPDTMQFCPWFLDYEMSKEIQVQTDFPPGFTGTLIQKLKLDKFATKVLYTEVDLDQLFDKVIVHEVRT